MKSLTKQLLNKQDLFVAGTVVGSIVYYLLKKRNPKYKV